MQQRCVFPVNEGVRLTNHDIHIAFSELGTWDKSKRKLAPSPNPQSIIGTLVRLPDQRDDDARLDPQMCALYRAVQRAEERDRVIITLYYLDGGTTRKYRKGRMPVKKMADMLGVSRRTFYRLLLEARRRVWALADFSGTI